MPVQEQAGTQIWRRRTTNESRIRWFGWLGCRFGWLFWFGWLGWLGRLGWVWLDLALLVRLASPVASMSLAPLCWKSRLFGWCQVATLVWAL